MPHPTTTSTGSRQAPTVIRMSSTGTTVLQLTSDAAPHETTNTVAETAVTGLGSAAVNPVGRHHRPNEKFLVVQAISDSTGAATHPGYCMQLHSDISVPLHHPAVNS